MSKEQLNKAFFAQTEEEVLAELNSTRDGLTKEEAAKRLAEYGENVLEAGEKRTTLQKILGSIQGFHDSRSISCSDHFWYYRS